MIYIDFLQECNFKLLFQNGHDFIITQHPSCEYSHINILTYHNFDTFSTLTKIRLKLLSSFFILFLFPSLFSFLNDFRGGKFLEAPVSGSKVPADMAQLIFLCAGDEEVLM
jgi:hypothetical protein